MAFLAWLVMFGIAFGGGMLTTRIGWRLDEKAWDRMERQAKLELIDRCPQCGTDYDDDHPGGGE